MFLDFFGRDRRPETLSQRDWDRFIQARRAGRAGRSGQPVGNRTIAWDLTFLMTVLNWAARSRDEEGNLLLDSNPLKGLRKPREKNPNRVVLTGTSTGRCSGSPGRSGGGSMSRSCSRTRRGTGSEPSAS